MLRVKHSRTASLPGYIVPRERGDHSGGKALTTEDSLTCSRDHFHCRGLGHGLYPCRKDRLGKHARLPCHSEKKGTKPAPDLESGSGGPACPLKADMISHQTGN